MQGAAAQYFGGKKNEEAGETQEHQDARQEACRTHWQESILLHPDLERAKRLLSKESFPDNEDICREILLIEYPEEVPHETAEIFDDFSWEYILDDVIARNTAKDVKVWRSLLDIAGTSLKDDSDTAEKLRPDWNGLLFPKQDQGLPLLLALEGGRFA